MKLLTPPGIPAIYTQSIERAIRENKTIAGLPTYADDTAAGTAGLTEGNLYKTATGQVMVKL